MANVKGRFSKARKRPIVGQGMTSVLCTIQRPFRMYTVASNLCTKRDGHMHFHVWVYQPRSSDGGRLVPGGYRPLPEVYRHRTEAYRARASLRIRDAGIMSNYKVRQCSGLGKRKDACRIDLP